MWFKRPPGGRKLLQAASADTASKGKPWQLESPEPTPKIHICFGYLFWKSYYWAEDRNHILLQQSKTDPAWPIELAAADAAMPMSKTWEAKEP